MEVKAKSKPLAPLSAIVSNPKNRVVKPAVDDANQDRIHQARRI
jgi:hypothetical protein